MITASGPSRSRGKKAGQSHSALRPGARRDLKKRLDPSLRTVTVAAASGGSHQHQATPPPSHRSASSVLTGEFSKLGPCRSRASRSAGHLAAG
ncbi:hypothetical protein NDU88_003812 [Pleurodeles waltl]|uniref:Uncharacterized protein n=1 Tax=Pleurodeles waltl TaxID=8319 RepID=A0AAV7UDW8_PLEWA|nr:hypothetical protein NDU88_003812 [Pleurodeles waltl]